MKYEKGSFTVVPNIQKMKGQKPYIQAVFMWLCFRANQDGECFPSRKLLSEEVGASTDSVDRAVIKLQELGVLLKENRFNGNEKTTNQYTILMNNEGGRCERLGGGHERHRTISIELDEDSSSELLRNSSSLSHVREEIAESQSIDSLPVGNAVHTIPPSAAAPPFQEFWQLYPRKTSVSKALAEKSWSRIKDHQEVLAGLKRYNAYWKKEKTEERFIPHPATWLNQKRWEDEVQTTNFKLNPL